MDNKVHLVVPMAGKGSRFSSEGFSLPKPLISIYEKPFFYWATQSVYKFVQVASVNFVVLQEHIDNFGIDKEIYSYFPEANIHIIEEVTEGAVMSSLVGVRDINDQYPIVFNDCDHLFKSKAFYEICNGNTEIKFDGILLTFYSDEPKYSFVEKNESGKIIRTSEKEVISNEAICGCYYFKNLEIFKTAVNAYRNNCRYQEYFMSGLYDELIYLGHSIHSVRTDFHIPFGVPSEYEKAKHFKGFTEFL